MHRLSKVFSNYIIKQKDKLRVRVKSQIAIVTFKSDCILKVKFTHIYNSIIHINNAWPGTEKMGKLYKVFMKNSYFIFTELIENLADGSTPLLEENPPRRPRM